MQSARIIPLEYVHFSYLPLKFVISSSVTYPVYNFKTVQDIFMKLHTNINQH